MEKIEKTIKISGKVFNLVGVEWVLGMSSGYPIEPCPKCGEQELQVTGLEGNNPLVRCLNCGWRTS